MQFSQKIDGLRQKDSPGHLELLQLYEQNPFEIFFIFTIYQNYTCIGFNRDIDKGEHLVNKDCLSDTNQLLADASLYVNVSSDKGEHL